jgi:hypothetical protein
MDDERTTGDAAPEASTDGPTYSDRRGAEDTPAAVGSEEPLWSTPPAGQERNAAVDGGEDVPVGEGTGPNEEATLERVRTVSRLLDDAVRVPGTDFRIGIDPILGVLPVAGDAVAMLLSLYPVLEAYRLGMSRAALAKMLSLVAVDAVVGSVPVLGPVFDAFWKANKWNLRTLERHIEQG